MTLDSLIAAAIAREASDIHLRAHQYPMLRVNGVLEWQTTFPIVSHDDLEDAASRLLTPDQKDRLTSRQEVDAALVFSGLGRCRASVFRQRGTLAISLRLIPSNIPNLAEIGLPDSVMALARESRGLILITGATGSGKSTTLAALVSEINRTRPVHILTIEDPIEFIHEDAKSIISQREVGLDVQSYSQGVLSALRQDPDVILLGELRDPETIETALVAAETGHLVLSTLHTLDAPETVNRIVAAFQVFQQPQIRHQLARVLRATVSQRLLPRADGKGRALATEVLVSTAYVRDCIGDMEKTSLLAGAIASGGEAYGMQNFDQSILALCRSGAVSVDEASNWVTNVDEFKMRLAGITPGSASFRR
ncbi:MAG: PilT/PilU family type 4a pilus ATPase [Vicinamibacterales bacterium]